MKPIATSFKKMAEIHLICVGKLKDKNLEVLEKDYMKRINSFQFKIHEVKSHSEDLEKEGAEVLKKLQGLTQSSSTYHPIALMEKGEERTSPKFSKWLFDLLLNENKKLVFIIGGASGHAKEVLHIIQDKISLGKLTYPHKIARLLIVEQLYRAQTIQIKHPYHK